MMPRYPTGIAAVALAALVVVACAILVGLDKIDGNDFMLVVVGPVIGGTVGVGAYAAGSRSGSQATLNPPPEA